MSYSALGVAPVVVGMFVVRLAEFFWSSVKVAGAIRVQGGEGSSSDEEMSSGRSSFMEASNEGCVVGMLLVRVAVRVRCSS